jgi:hypothetical protein
MLARLAERRLPPGNLRAKAASSAARAAQNDAAGPGHGHGRVRRIDPDARHQADAVTLFF